MNPQAAELNDVLAQSNPEILEMLSKQGKEIFFPKKGLMAQSMDAKGKAINATIGMASEEDGSPMRLTSIEKNILLDPSRVFPYTTSFGVMELRKTWLEMMREKNPGLKEKTLSLPVVTCALTHGLSMAGYMFVDPGDEIILPDLYWGNYNLIFKNAYGAEVKTYPLFEGTSFNAAGLEELLLAEGDKKVVIMNFPNNPTGFSPNHDETVKIVAAFKKAAEAGKKIVAIIDDAYFGLIFEDGLSQESIFSELTDLHKNILAVKIDGATKEDYVWGFRVGFITYGSKDISLESCRVLADKTAGAVRGNVSNCPHISQNLLLEAFQSPDYESEKAKKYTLLKNRYLKIKELIDGNEELAKYMTPVPYNSGYFMCLKMKDLDAEKVRQILLEKYDTGIIALGDLLRIAYSALSLEQLPVLIGNIVSACQDASE